MGWLAGCLAGLLQRNAQLSSAPTSAGLGWAGLGREMTGLVCGGAALGSTAHAPRFWVKLAWGGGSSRGSAAPAGPWWKQGSPPPTAPPPALAHTTLKIRVAPGLWSP